VLIKIKDKKVNKYRSRQDTFLKAIENKDKPMAATSWEIIALDVESYGVGTLRKQIMAIKSKVNAGNALFLSVDVSFFRGNEVIFSFLPRHETEARAFVSNIVPYFQHKYKTLNMHDFFHPDAIQRANQSIWDADGEEVLTSSDLYLDQSNDGCDDFDMLEIMGIKETVNQQSTGEIERVERLFTGDEGTSVGSLFTQDANPKQAIKLREDNVLQNITTPTRSVCTTLTIEEVDQKLNNMSTEIATIKDMIKALAENKIPQTVSQDQAEEMLVDHEINKKQAGETNTSPCSNQ
jgi:hypothetical protein